MNPSLPPEQRQEAQQKLDKARSKQAARQKDWRDKLKAVANDPSLPPEQHQEAQQKLDEYNSKHAGYQRDFRSKAPEREVLESEREFRIEMLAEQAGIDPRLEQIEQHEPYLNNLWTEQLHSRVQRYGLLKHSQNMGNEPTQRSDQQRHTHLLAAGQPPHERHYLELQQNGQAYPPAANTTRPSGRNTPQTVDPHRVAAVYQNVTRPRADQRTHSAEHNNNDYGLG